MSSSAGGQEAEAYASRGAEGTTYVPRDRDPPLGYDGENPEVSFKVYEKAVRLWQFETDVLAVKQKAKLLRALSGTAKLAVEDLEFEDHLKARREDDLGQAQGVLHAAFGGVLPRAVETAVYGSVRHGKESFIEYVARMDRAFANLKREGVDLPEHAQGYQGGPTPRHQNHVVFPYPKMEPRKGLRPMVGRHRVPCVGQGSSRNGLAGQGPVVDICAEETGAFQCNVVQRQCNIECNTGRNVVNSQGSAHLSRSDSHFHKRGRKFLVVREAKRAQNTVFQVVLH